MNILFIDDEPIAVKQFEARIKSCTGFEEVHTFSRVADILQFVETKLVNTNDSYAAFLDIEMPHLKGTELAVKLREMIPDIQICFITAYENFALDAYKIDAIGYLTKPYSTEQLQHEIDKLADAVQTAKSKSREQKKSHTTKGHTVYFKTMPFFEIYIDDKIVTSCTAKPKELFALLVSRNGAEVTRDMAIGCLWPDRENNETTGSLFRMTMMRLKQFLIEKDIEDILVSSKISHSLNVDLYDSDIKNAVENHVLDKKEPFLTEYSWASFVQ
jgi:two-component SAPR family response regulator